tara:strand:+ start:243 stop:452 length:210 start_codon:yes stop_codon:yes gene_type:complete
MPETTVQAFKNGPFIIKGPIKVLDVDGNEYDVSDQKAIALCRCGQSENRPFCDGKHNRIGFNSEKTVES